jgi:hypothetical protein
MILAIYFLMELCALVAFGYWGFHVEGEWIVRTVLGLGTPLVAAIIWGSFLAPKAPFPVSTRLRVFLKLIFFSSAAFLLNFSGESHLSLFFMIVVLIEILIVDLLKIESSTTF